MCPVFEAIFEHPFVQGIGNGNLQPGQLTHYVKQDFEYLNTFMQIYGLAISRSERREDMQLLNEQISFVLNDEVHPHNNFCQVAGVNYEDLQYELSHQPLITILGTCWMWLTEGRLAK